MTDSGAGTEFRLRDILLPAYGPSLVNAIGHGAVMPLLALRARELGADVSTAAMVVAALGVGSLIASLPASALVARIGERRTLTLGGCLDAVTLAAAALTDSVLALGLAMAISGATWTAFLMARQGYMIDAVPIAMRARALAALGGAMRIGVFIGPLLGAVVVHRFGLAAVFWLAAGMSLSSALLALSMPDLGSERRTAITQHRSVLSVLAEHRTVLLTLGSAVIVLAASRSIRTALLPLWADHVGLSASTTSLLFAVAAAIDIAFFYPGGWLMDHRGRAFVAVPVVAASALACLLLPLASTAWSVGAVLALIALGNGIGAGIVMTLGADAAPVDGRAQFLGGWRVCGDLGGSGGPLLVSGLAALMPLAAVCVVLGIFGVLGTAWVRHWTLAVDRERASADGDHDLV